MEESFPGSFRKRLFFCILSICCLFFTQCCIKKKNQNYDNKKLIFFYNFIIKKILYTFNARKNKINTQESRNHVKYNLLKVIISLDKSCKLILSAISYCWIPIGLCRTNSGKVQVKS